MDQLIQMELTHIQHQLETSSLLAKKCGIYEGQAQDPELKAILKQSADTHNQHVKTLMDQLRRFNGKSKTHS